MSYGKAGGAQLGNGGSSSDTSQYGMNNNQYNQSYPNTSMPQPVTSRQFGQGPVQQSQQPGQGLQFNQPANQPALVNSPNNNNTGNWGKGGGSATGKPGAGSTVNSYQQAMQAGNYQPNFQAVGLSGQDGSASSSIAPTQNPSDMLPLNLYNSSARQLFNPVATIAPVSYGSIPQSQLATPSVYSPAQANSNITI